jgi:hypothetical protein
VIVVLIAIIAGFFMAIVRMRMDIFPEVGNPVIYVAQPYGGMLNAAVANIRLARTIARIPVQMPMSRRRSKLIGFGRCRKHSMDRAIAMLRERSDQHRL